MTKRSVVSFFSNRKRSLGTQRGGVLVMVAIFLPVLLLFASFVIDTANWWVHKQHLQTQADSAALASADGFTNCNDNVINSLVAKYSGTQASGYNQQIGNTPLSRVHLAINSPTFYGQTAVDPDI